MKRVFSAVMFILLSTSMLTMALKIQPVKSQPRDMDITMDDASILASVLIDYENGSTSWFGRVMLPYGATALNATLTVATVNYEFYVDLGVLVKGINGVFQSQQCHWNWLYWNSTESVWIYGPVPCDKYLLTKGDIIAWVYENIESPTGPTRPPPPRTIIVPDDYPKIQGAINAAYPEDTIFVRAGIYYENVVVNKTVALIGENREATIIDGTGSTIFRIKASDVTVSSFTIRGASAPSTGVVLEYSIDRSLSNHTIVNNNMISGNSGHGISIGSDYNIITNNLITNNAFAYSGYCGISFYSSNHNTVLNNTLSDNAGHGISLGQGSFNVIESNSITNNGYGHLPYYEHAGLVIGPGTTDNQINENIIEGNQQGMLLVGSSNKIYHNNIINNTKQTVTQETYVSVNVWDDGYPSGGNYWSDYSGIDLHGGPYQNETGSDGVGDAPYVIDGDNMDRYPLMKPYGSLLGDVNGDGTVNMKDVMAAVQAFNSFPGQPRWNPNADIDTSGRVDMRDLVMIVLNFNKRE